MATMVGNAKRVIGALGALSFGIGLMLLPASSFGLQLPQDPPVSSDSMHDEKAVADELDSSARAHENSAAKEGAGSGATRSNGSPRASETTRDDLRKLLDTTRVDDLEPLASGYAPNDAGTAPYDSCRPNADDVDGLKEARNHAQAVIDSASSSQDEIATAYERLKQAFASVRFIYHYTGSTGTNGARIFDDNGNLLQAHGAGIQKVSVSKLPARVRAYDADHDGYIYILCGEDKTDKLIARGVRIYYSDDLLNWKDQGLGFQTYHGDADLAKKRAGADKTYQRYYNVDNIRQDPDYTNIYGRDFSAFSQDSSNHNIDSPQAALDLLLWDLKALKGDGSDPSQSSCVFERPKMAYNAATQRWVIWFHADGPQYGNEDTATYSKAKAGVAISEGADPAGPYKYLGSFRMSPGNNSGNPGMARDMNLYIDSGKDLGTKGVDDAYLIYSSNENRDLTISLLDRTYTKLIVPNAQQRRGTDVADGDTYNIIASNSKESPAPFKWNGRYYIVYSGTTGWSPNENKYAVSETDDILGPYREVGTPFVKGTGEHQDPGNSFETQSSSIIPFDGENGIFLYWGDRWFNPDTGNDISQSRYVMTPMQMVNGQLSVLPAADWKLENMDSYRAIEVLTRLPSEADSMASLRDKLPGRLSVRVGGERKPRTTKVTWKPYFGPDEPAGYVTISGALPEFNDVEIQLKVTVYPKDAALFIDAGSDASHESDYYKALRDKVPDLMNDDAADRVYTPNAGWGLISKIGTDVDRYDTDQSDIFDTGYWAHEKKSITYQVDLPKGSYTVQAGYREWWHNKRQTVFSVASSSGQSLGRTTIVPSESGNSTEQISFTLDAPTAVSFSTTSTSGGDPVLSWIAVNHVADDQISSVDPVTDTVRFIKGNTPKLPAKVRVNRFDGRSETRRVTWLVDQSALTPYAPTKIQGVVAGTSLPASASVQMFEDGLSYFIDVNGGDHSSSYDAANKLAPEGLANAKSDQPFDGIWGNASENYGVKSQGDENPFESGIYAGSDGHVGSLSYSILLAPGKHRISFGFHDWWSQQRPTTISYRYDGMAGDVPATGQSFISATVDGGQTVASGTIEIPQGWNKLVTFTLTSPTGSGPVLSWISVVGSKPLGPSPVQPAPIIKGIDDVEIALGAKFDKMAGVTATDENEGDITSRISVTGEVDTSKEGSYALTYSVTNSQGAAFHKTRTVTVTASSGADPSSRGGLPGTGSPLMPVLILPLFICSALLLLVRRRLLIRKG